jgi:hypothetical protein
MRGGGCRCKATWLATTLFLVSVAGASIGARQASKPAREAEPAPEKQYKVGDRFELKPGVMGTVPFVWPDQIKVQPEGAEPYDLVVIDLPLGSIRASEETATPTTTPAKAQSPRYNVGDVLTTTREFVWLHSEPGVRDSEIWRNDLRSNNDRIVVTGVTTRKGQTWYKVRIGCDCLIGSGLPQLGKMPDSNGWLLSSDVRLVARAAAAGPAPKQVESNPRLTVLKEFNTASERLLRECDGEPEHQARIRELQKQMGATIYSAGSDWMEASKLLMDAIRMRAGRCH